MEAPPPPAGMPARGWGRSPEAEGPARAALQGNRTPPSAFIRVHLWLKNRRPCSGFPTYPRRPSISYGTAPKECSQKNNILEVRGPIPQSANPFLLS